MNDNGHLIVVCWSESGDSRVSGAPTHFCQQQWSFKEKRC